MLEVWGVGVDEGPAAEEILSTSNFLRISKHLDLWLHELKIFTSQSEL